MKKAKKTKKRATKRIGTGLKIARFFPAVAITLVASYLWYQPTLRTGNSDVLAYATEISVSGLLSSTNAQRAANGVGALANNSKLNSAAQAKANDMVTRNYWSHQTPDGQQPWVFITNAGYQYLSAGENLAYGFSTSAANVTGWMNSPPHKANLLNTNYTEVGFGFANSANYVGDGPQTVVVAMYGKPQVASATTPPPSSNPAASAPKAQAKAPTSAPAPAPAEPVQEAPKEPEPEAEPIAVADIEKDLPPPAAPANVSRVQILTGGNAAWSTTAVIMGVLSAGMLWMIHKGFHLRRYVLASEHFVARHVHLDFTVLAIVYLGFVLLTHVGNVR